VWKTRVYTGWWKGSSWQGTPRETCLDFPHFLEKLTWKLIEKQVETLTYFPIDFIYYKCVIFKEEFQPDNG
jgi:hypothetical protein